ncbi:MAG: hypothetical protein ACREQ5_28955 [Candidatus Dormibacteria bacterium]
MGKVLLTILRAQWDRIAAIVAVVLGGLAMLNGWIGVSGTALTAEQMPYIVSGGLVGIFLVGVAAVLWLSADLRDEWRKLADLEERLESLEGRLPAAEPPPLPTAEVAPPATPNGRPASVEPSVTPR